MAVDRRCGTDFSQDGEVGFKMFPLGRRPQVRDGPTTSTTAAVANATTFPLGRRPQVRDGPAPIRPCKRAERVSSWPSTAGAGRTWPLRIAVKTRVSSWPSTAGAGRTGSDGSRLAACSAVSSWPSTAGAGRTNDEHRLGRIEPDQVSSWPSTAGAGRTLLLFISKGPITEVSSWPSTAGAGRTSLSMLSALLTKFPLGRRPQVRDGRQRRRAPLLPPPPRSFLLAVDRRCGTDDGDKRRPNPHGNVSSWPSTAGAGRTRKMMRQLADERVSSWPSTAGAGRTWDARAAWDARDAFPLGRRPQVRDGRP